VLVSLHLDHRYSCPEGRYIKSQPEGITIYILDNPMHGSGHEMDISNESKLGLTFARSQSGLSNRFADTENFVQQYFVLSYAPHRGTGHVHKTKFNKQKNKHD
jgi:hypothetical protein